MKKRYYVVIVITIALFAFSFARRLHGSLDFGTVAAGLTIRNGGLHLAFRTPNNPVKFWVNGSCYEWTPLPGDHWYYEGYPEFGTAPASVYRHWRLCGFQLVTYQPWSRAFFDTVDVVMPVWMPSAAYFCFVGWYAFRRRQLMKAGKCLCCKHILVGQTICPECGTTSHRAILA